MTDQSLPGAEGVTEIRRNQRSLTFWFVNLVIHRWAGIAAMLWLAVLSATGIILDHPEWRWSQQTTWTERFASDHVFKDETLGVIVRKFQVNPDNRDQLIGGGTRGLWRTQDGGATWTDIAYDGAGGTPMLYDILPSKTDPWGTVWLGTDDGIWQVSGADGNATRIGLEGVSIKDMDLGTEPNEIIGIADKSRLFRLSTNDPAAVQWIEPDGVEIPGLPQDVSLARILVDLHIGVGFTGGDLAIWINDFGGAVVIILSLTGLLYWLFPRLWRNPETKAKWDKNTRSSTLRWLFRFHGPILGLLAIIPIIYLSVTGIFLDHARALLPSTMGMTTSVDVAPGPYRLTSLDGEMDALRTDPTRPGYITLMTRMGLIRTTDGGANWVYDETTPFAVNQRHHNAGFVHRGDVTFMGNHGGPISLRSDIDGVWSDIPSRMMVQDAAPLGDTWMLKGSGGFMEWNPQSGDLTPLNIQNPPLEGMPIIKFMTDLHTGMMIHSSFVWVNDLAALIAILMCFTGFLAWWHKKWI